MMNPMAMSASKLGRQRQYTPLHRANSGEELASKSPRRSTSGDLSRKKLHFGIEDDDQIEEMLSCNTFANLEENRLKIVSSIGSKSASETYLKDGDRIEMYTTGSLVGCGPRCCPQNPLSFRNTSAIGISKSSQSGSSYLTKEECLQLSASRLSTRKGQSSSSQQRFAIKSADDEDWPLIEEAEMKTIGCLSMTPPSKVAKKSKEVEWAVTNTNTGKLFRFKVSETKAKTKAISVYHSGVRVGHFTLRRQMTDLLRLRLKWDAVVRSEGESELMFLLLCFQVIHASS